MRMVAAINGRPHQVPLTPMADFWEHNYPDLSSVSDQNLDLDIRASRGG